MINSEKPFDIHDYIEILRRRLWYIIIPFVLISLGTIVYIFLAPKEYKATATILITPQKVPEQFVKPTVTTKIEDRIQAIGQEILSRPRLENIISEFKLNPQGAHIEDLLGLMRNNIKIETSKKDSRERNPVVSYFTIAYSGGDPRTVARVANRLASIFIEENLKLREQASQGTSEFISVELQATKARLDEQERMVANFKRQFMGELPEQKDANTKVLDQLQINYQRVAESLRAAQDRRLVIQKQISDTEDMIAAASSPKEVKEGTQAPSPSSPLLVKSSPLQLKNQPKTAAKNSQETELEKLKSNLVDLQAKYTEKHPDILIMKKKIADLEPKVEKAKLQGELEEKKESEQKQETSSTVVTSSLPAPRIEMKKIEEKPDSKLQSRLQDQGSQLVANGLEIERLREEGERVKAQIAKYRERIENTPLREQAFANLTRDYTSTKDAYKALMTKTEEAQQAENMERRQKGEQFGIVNAAQVPEKPDTPDVTKVLLIGLLAASGSGLGIAFLREQLDRSFRDADDFEAAIGLRVLANIPSIKGKTA